MLIAAKEAAWSGDHDQSIAICTSGLARQDFADSQRMELLDVRAESFIALGKLDLAEQDVRDMHELAAAEVLPEYIAKALNRQARVETIHGKLDAAIASAEVASESARAAGKMQLEADCLTTLAEAHSQARHTDPVFDAGERAVALYRQLGDLAGEGRAHVELAYAYHDIGDNVGNQRAAEKAVVLCREAGDQYGLSLALNARRVPDPDIARKIDYLNQALKASQNAGYLKAQALTLGNLSSSYISLGLFRHARRLSFQTQSIARRTGALMELAWAVADVAHCEIELENSEAARKSLTELEQLALVLDKPYWTMVVEGIKGGLAKLEDDLPAAMESLKNRMHLDHVVSDIATLDGLAEVYLAMGDADAALEVSTQALDLLGSDEIGEQDFHEIWWHHSQALLATGQEDGASDALRKAYRYLVRTIANISDEGLRRSFLNKLAINRQLIDAWIAQGREQGLGEEEIYAHLQGKVDLREPFHRLVDTGLRLNQLYSKGKLYDFMIEEATELSGAERILLILERENGQELVSSQMPNDEDAQALFETLGEHLEETRHSRTVHLETADSPDSPTPSCIVAPLIAQNRLMGYLYADMDARYGSLLQTDADMLGMLASQAAVALENVGLVEGLEEQVVERTAELQEANKQAEEARHIAEGANQAKSTFLANMSHELRTPLNAIIGFTRIVKRKAKGNLPEKQVDNLGKVQSSAEHLLGLINSILDIAKIEAGGMDVHATKFEVGQLIEMCLATAQPLARRGVTMRAAIDPDLPSAFSDQDKIKQILLNLLSNAAKFTHEGEIVAEVSIPRSDRLPIIPAGALREAPLPEAPLLEIRVIDTGIGMNEEQVGRVFEEFQQADETTTRKYGGTGLGLPISKQLAQLLGGELTASSETGEGSTFTLIIPLRYEDQERVP